MAALLVPIKPHESRRWVLKSTPRLLTASVMDHYQSHMALAMQLIIFVPLIISAAGSPST